MNIWTELQDRAGKAGRTMPVVDSLLATTARCHALTLATRNVGDFLQAEVSVMNPWTDS